MKVTVQYLSGKLETPIKTERQVFDHAAVVVLFAENGQIYAARQHPTDNDLIEFFRSDEEGFPLEGDA